MLDALRQEIVRLQGRTKLAEDASMKRSQAQEKAASEDRKPDEWAAIEKQYQTEIKNLARLCRNQTDQLESQDATIRQLRKKLNPNS